MNEIAILMHLLSRRKNNDEIGSTEKELFKFLNLTGKYKELYLNELLLNLANYIEPLGLELKYNFLNKHWFITFNPLISNIIKSTPFASKPSLAATLFSIIALCFKNSGKCNLTELSKLRKKKVLTNDIKELEKLGYISFLNKEKTELLLTPRIAYELDLNDLLLKISLKLKKSTSL